jgi:hypothetical protein
VIERTVADALSVPVPEISRFFGVVISMYFNDHAPPHFHARYRDRSVRVNILTGEILSGSVRGRSIETSCWRTGNAPGVGSRSGGSRRWSSRMTPRLIDASYVGGYKIHLKYADGVEGTIDLEDELWGEVFEPLRDLNQFKAFRLDSELDTLVWPTGADLAPEFLYASVSGASRN